MINEYNFSPEMSTKLLQRRNLHRTKAHLSCHRPNKKWKHSMKKNFLKIAIKIFTRYLVQFHIKVERHDSLVEHEINRSQSLLYKLHEKKLWQRINYVKKNFAICKKRKENKNIFVTTLNLQRISTEQLEWLSGLKICVVRGDECLLVDWWIYLFSGEENLQVRILFIWRLTFIGDGWDLIFIIILWEVEVSSMELMWDRIWHKLWQQSRYSGLIEVYLLLVCPCK